MNQDCRANPLIDRKVVGVVFFDVAAMVAMITSPTTVLWCSSAVVAVVVVVELRLWCSVIRVEQLQLYLRWCNECRAMSCSVV